MTILLSLVVSAIPGLLGGLETGFDADASVADIATGETSTDVGAAASVTDVYAGSVTTGAGSQLYSNVVGVASTLPIGNKQQSKTMSYIIVELKNVTINDDHDEAGGIGEIEINTIAMSGLGVPHTLTWPIKVQDSSWYEADEGDVIIVNAPIFCERESEISDVLAVVITAIDNDELPEWIGTFTDIWFGLGQALSGLVKGYGAALKGALQLEQMGVDALLEYLSEDDLVGVHGKAFIPSDWESGYLSVIEENGDMTVNYEIRRIQVPVRTPPVAVKLLNVTGIGDEGWGDDADSEPFIHTRVLNDLTLPEMLIQRHDFGPKEDVSDGETWIIDKEIFRIGAVGPFLHIEIDVWEEDTPSIGDDHDMVGVYSGTFYPDENWGIGSTIVERRSGIDEGDVWIRFEIIGLPFYNVGVSLSPSSLEVEPGYTETYAVTVTNLGNLEDAYGLSLSGLPSSWYVFSEESISLGPSESTQVTLNVTPTRHWSTAPGGYDFTVTATSINDSEATDNDYGVITILPFHETQLFVVPNSFWAQPGDIVTYTIGVQNLGNVRDDYNVSAEFVNPGGLFVDPRWTTLWPYVFWGLDSGSTGTGYLEISVPEDWAANGLEEATYTFTAFAICQVDPTATDEVTRTLNVTVGPRTLSITLSGEFDYAFKEPVTIKISALVKDVKSRQPISNADVSIKIYAPNGDLLWSDQMGEMETGNGLYIWESEETIQDIMKGPHWQPYKGVYTVYVTASYNEGPTGYEALEFHIDPPAESADIPIYYPAAAIIASLAAIVAFRQLHNRRFHKPKVQ